MEKYTETKDLEEVANAIKAGRRVECDGRRVTRGSKDLSLHWGDYDCHALTALPGRVFKIEVPRPDPGEGWRLLEPGEDTTDKDQIFHKTDTECAPQGPKQLSRYWYRRRVEAEKPKPKRRRVELVWRAGYLRYIEYELTATSHVHAQSMRGFIGYEYAEFGPNDIIPHTTYVNMEGKMMFPVAFWVEESGQ
jgi:hypothetical protein